MKKLLYIFLLFSTISGVLITGCKHDPTPPTVSTDAISDITLTSARATGNITDDGGAEVIERGVCWSVTANPDISDQYSSDGAGSGEFSSEMTNLSEETVYHVRAYATNKAGTSYGDDLTFSTLASTMATVTTRAITDVTYSTANSGGDISDDGGAAVTTKGICWDTSENPTIQNSHSSDGSGKEGYTSSMTGLTQGTTYYVRAYATNGKGTAYGNQVSFTTSSVSLPSVSTKEITDITMTAAKSGGDISSDGGASVTAKGICWGTSENPTTEGSHSTAGTGTESFISDMTGLSENTTYYVRAYAVNSKGTAYGNQISFTTVASGAAILTTKAVTDISLSSARSGGEIDNDGGSPVTAKGICWGTTENPTIDNSHTTDGTGTGGFISSMSGLSGGTTYYVRAYAINGNGTAYGNQVTFTTPEAGVAVLTTKTLTDISVTSARSGGDITSDGGAAITAKGVCWSTSENPTADNAHTNDGTGTGSFNSIITGLNEGTTYYVRAYATNSRGTSYGNQQTLTTALAVLPTLTTKVISDITITTAKTGGDITNDGDSPITAKGVCWSTTENPTTANDHTDDGTGTGSFVSVISGLTAGTTYYTRAYATNSKGTAYGNQVTFQTNAANAPQLTTTEVTSITTTTAISGGNITNNGGAPVTERGICWGTSHNPVITGNKTSDGGGNGLFTSNITGLSEGTLYFVRAYATNSNGTSYGNEFTFTTPVTDIEGNIYRTVLIGNQVWMAENLKTTKLNDGTDINNTTDPAAWVAHNTALTAGFCWYNNNSANKDVYGALYNWFTVNTGRLCPSGWHVPTYAEYSALELYIGVPADSINSWGWRGKNNGTSLKNTTGWTAGNGNNSTGFSAIPAGYRAWANGEFRGTGILTYFWTGSDNSMNHEPNTAWYRRLDGADTRIYNATTERGSGKSVRCMKNP